MIDWLTWGRDAFERGRAEGRPLLLALTATWCHACHRMDDETWDDPGVAAAVGRLAVPVKVDADAHPEVYARYHMGGLPSVALLGADGAFVRGATFLTAAEMHRFLDLAADDWRGGRRPAPRTPAASAGVGALVQRIVARIVRRADPEHGGLGVAPKLPEVEALTLLLRCRVAARGDAVERVVRGALDAIVRHLGDRRDGGFFRYAAGADWSGPHTEKLALDQAQIARLLLEAGSALAEPRYVDAATRALDHARRRLADARGRVLASVAADPEYYGGDPTSAPAPSGMGVMAEASPGTTRVPASGDRPAGPATPTRPATASSAADWDPDRVDRPAVDARRFADAGAAMLAAAMLERALTGIDHGFDPEYRRAAPDGAIPHRLDAAEGVKGLLREQALGLTAALSEYRLTGDRALLAWGERVADFAITELWDEAARAFRSEPEGARLEAALPPMFPLLANGEMAQALADLADHTGRTDYAAVAERAVASLAGRAVLSPAGPALALAALRLEIRPAGAELAGDPRDPRARALARAAVAALGPTVVVRWTGGQAPGITICRGDLCLPPLSDPREVLEALIAADLAPHGILTLWSSSGPRHEGLAS